MTGGSDLTDHDTIDFDNIDFFSDTSLLDDPYPYFEHLRDKCPVTATPHHGVVAVTGWDEASEIYRDVNTFSSCNSVVGPFAEFPVPLEGDDVSDIIEEYRDQLPMNEHMVTMDPPMHTRERGLLMRLLTPRRLKENEEFMWTAADRMLDEFLADGQCEFISAYSQPFAMLAVADVLGVPESDHGEFRNFFGLSLPPGMMSVPRTRHHRGRGSTTQQARHPRRLVRQLHRGSSEVPSQGCAHRPRTGHLHRWQGS